MSAGFPSVLKPKKTFGFLGAENPLDFLANHMLSLIARTYRSRHLL
jgi:hypothetical protein